MAFWITLGRSFFAMALGVALLFYPDKARPLLGNFIGGFWIAGSLLTLRWGLGQERSKLLTILVALAGALAGLAVVGRNLIDRWVPGEGLTNFLGMLAILTGLLHLTGHLQVKRFTKIPRTNSGIILGVFEVFLGIILLLTPYITLQNQPFLNFVTIAWALAGGVIIFFDALGIRREAKLKQEAEDS
jgi:uncharacterized membrane protein HdeD (DUF308 family)